MRIPFDLIAIILAIEPMRQTMSLLTVRGRGYNVSDEQIIRFGNIPFSTSESLVALLGFWLVTWLLHEALARHNSWKTRFGKHPQGWQPDGDPLTEHPSEGHSRGVVLAQFLTACGYLVFLYYHRWNLKTSAWPEWLGLTGYSLHDRNVMRASQFVGNLLDMGPYVVAMWISWIPKYYHGRASDSKKDSLFRYLLFESRLTLLPFALCLLIGLFQDLTPAQVSTGFDQALNTIAVDSGIEWALTAELVCGLASMIFMAVVLQPLLILKFFQCQPLPDNEMKTRMMELLKKSGIKARAILSWGPKDSGFVNAAVIGPWSRLRYILISPALLRKFNDDECDAVLAHELGHAKHHHLSLLVVVIIAMAAILGLVVKYAENWMPLVQFVLMYGIMAMYIRFVYGAISRNCEKEADLASAEITGKADPLISSLEKLGEMAGGIRDVYTWHHGSIAERVEHLRWISLNAEAARAFHYKMKLVRIGLVAFTILCLAGLVFWK